MLKRKTIEDLEESFKKKIKEIEKENNKRFKELKDMYISYLTVPQIFQIIEDCNYDMIKYIILNKRNLDINMGYKGKTLLIQACQDRHEEVVRLLLANDKTDVNKLAFGFSHTPLYVACELFGGEGLVRLLLNHPATEVNQEMDDDVDMYTPLLIACQNGNEGAVQLMLSHPATDVNQASTNVHGFTPLYIACLKGYEGVVRVLLDHTATDLNQATTECSFENPTEYGFTPLNVSCYKRNTEIVKLLLSDSRTHRIRPTDEEDAQVYDEALRNVKKQRNARFRGLVRATVVFRRMRFRAAMIAYAPGGNGADAAAASFNNTVSTLG